MAAKVWLRLELGYGKLTMVKVRKQKYLGMVKERSWLRLTAGLGQNACLKCESQTLYTSIHHPTPHPFFLPKEIGYIGTEH